MNTVEPMEWNHSETLALANVKCVSCEGTGLRQGPDREGKSPCHCVLRSIFRACLKKFHFCAQNEPYRSKVVLMPCKGQDVNCTWTRTSDDFMADFYLVAKRTLSEQEFAIFRYHFLLGADSNLCCRQLKIDRGTFFHAVYRIQRNLGLAYSEIRPYPLYPVDEYFGGTVRKAKIYTMPSRGKQVGKNIVRPPLRKVA